MSNRINYPITLFYFLIFSVSIFGQKVNTDSLFEVFASSRLPERQIQRTDDHAHAKEEKCGFWIYNQIKYHFDSFSSQQQSILKQFLNPPETEKSIVSPSGIFRIHYSAVKNTPSYVPSLTPDQNALLAAQIADSVYAFEINNLGYPAPPADDTCGGDNKYDIYISECWPDYGITIPQLNGTYIRVDNDFNNYTTKGLNALRVTIAHEFFHAIQFSNYKPYNFTSNNEKFFYEASSTAMEEFMYDNVNDYYNYLKITNPGSYFYNPSRHLTEFDGYGFCIFPIFLKEKYGYDIIKTIWGKYKSRSALEAISSGISEYETTLAHCFNTFGIWAYFTGNRKQFADPVIGSFEEGEHYPLVSSTYLKFSETSFPVTAQMPSLSNLFYNVLIENGIYNDTVACLITNSNISGALLNSFDKFKLSIFDTEGQGATPIANNYFYKLDTKGNECFTEAAFFNNRIIKGGEFIITESDYPYPNPFVYEQHSGLRIPADYNQGNFAQLNIYSASMELLCSKTCRIIYPDGKFVIEWDGLDGRGDKLPTGVYIYTVKSGDNIKKGKLVLLP